ncbi:MAG TPA: 16S rRNA (uracil(1498)-N(3))-methyltransferase [Hypericibacter adhaerens]|jgi:16S rRNA (uracil1498-N3)-methyltransferase|uniref:Ribosomal RNA small subunit methyltransferase E n=1 Tax=Hypericibacter adhaerens TaxID=2602016 RepID=A0A5J6N1Q6_9PROT|nr:16S rRNA (uracil(1498)-N(3))-methyltransferase [Hypericibacter adhaerens]QEX20846.1 ribosomal RNA small subunit methyltransferase E [Hypericibacter adhaerens]HWA45891.1 16S rRNA (uracil(1498)-N(3))-methyltransferase [Hypericibacter adhaerens]
MNRSRNRDEEREPGQVTRLFVAPALAADAEIELDEEATHYLRHVLRLEAGDRVGLFNGRDGEWSAEILGLSKRATRLALREQTRAQKAEPDLWLVFAPIKRQRIDILAEKATELGVTALLPVFTQRTVMTRVNLDRLAAHAKEAAEQTERLTVPVIREPQSLDKMLQTWPQKRRLLLCAEAGPARPLVDALAELTRGRDVRNRNESWAIMTGPEGGFTPSELDALGKLPFVTPVGLGPRILRADTAAIAALACWQALVGDGRDRPPSR